MERYKNCARSIQAYWRSYRDRRLFKQLVNTVRSAEHCLAPAILRQLSPREAELLKDPSLKCKLKFRFAGPRFPPSLVFKIFHTGSGGHYLSGKTLFAPSNQATADTCRMMGNRTFLELITEDEIHRQNKMITEPQDVICMRDYMQYSSHLDELPACLGGRGNGWRFLSLKVLSREGVVGQLKKVLPFGHVAVSRFPRQQLSHSITRSSDGSSPVGSITSRRCSARAQSTAARKRRLYILDKAERFQVSEEKQVDNINNSNTNKQNRIAEKWDIQIVVPSVETEDCGDSSSDSEWEEEAEKLCNWSKQLDIDAVDAPELYGELIF
ncbi:uncharacterized protein CXorf58 homolog [Myxocyprinus asiaticus]|uniref:uncharacterized protein CXorf58 homolog n=1 Tax=Myxocyprinus asiaticus TaxID=70543 RepID=UPI002222688E|nr:uncharacterized protein CXorf58 homolog [Myxocyprinus asiaticus]